MRVLLGLFFFLNLPLAFSASDPSADSACQQGLRWGCWDILASWYSETNRGIRTSLPTFGGQSVVPPRRRVFDPFAVAIAAQIRRNPLPPLIEFILAPFFERDRSKRSELLMYESLRHSCAVASYWDCFLVTDWELWEGNWELAGTQLRDLCLGGHQDSCLTLRNRFPDDDVHYQTMADLCRKGDLVGCHWWVEDFKQYHRGGSAREAKEMACEWGHVPYCVELGNLALQTPGEKSAQYWFKRAFQFGYRAKITVSQKKPPTPPTLFAYASYRLREILSVKTKNQELPPVRH